MSGIDALRGAMGALTVGRAGRRGRSRTGPNEGSRPEPVGTVAAQRDLLAQILYASDQGFWPTDHDESSGPDSGSPGTAWRTSTERYLRGPYLDRADAILAAGFRQAPTLTRGSVEAAQRSEGSTSDPDDWIVVAWALGLEVDGCG